MMPGDQQPSLQQPSLRERNRVRARAEIASAALRLFAVGGFERVTVDDIVAEAGVSRRTFFRYFETKEDALLADYPELTLRLTESLGRRTDEDVLEVLRDGLHRLAEWYEERGQAVLERSRILRGSVNGAGRNLEFLAQWEKAIAASLAAHTGDVSGLLSRTAAAAVVGAFKAALSQWVRSEGKEDLHSLTDQALDYVTAGLRSCFEPPL